MESPFEHGKEPFVSITGGEFHDQLRDNQFLRMDSATTGNSRKSGCKGSLLPRHFVVRSQQRAKWMLTRGHVPWSARRTRDSSDPCWRGPW